MVPQIIQNGVTFNSDLCLVNQAVYYSKHTQGPNDEKCVENSCATEAVL